MTLIPTWFLSEYKTSYLKQAVTSLPHQPSIYNTGDPTNHITEPGRCHGNFSTHPHTGSPQWPGIHNRPSSPCSSAYFTEELKCWPRASKWAAHLLKIFLNTQNSSSCNNGNFLLNTVFQFLQWMWIAHTSVSLSSNPTAESWRVTIWLTAGLITRHYCNSLNPDIKTSRFASDRQMEMADFNMTTDSSTLETAKLGDSDNSKIYCFEQPSEQNSVPYVTQFWQRMETALFHF